MSEERLAAVEQGLADVKHGLLDVREQLGGVETRLDGVENRLGRVEISQEVMRDEIHQIAEGHASTQAMIQRGFEALHLHIDRRIDPLELALKQHLRAS